MSYLSVMKLHRKRINLNLLVILSSFFLNIVGLVLSLRDPNDKYLNTSENVHRVNPCFNLMKAAYEANDTTKLKRICEEFHDLAGMGSAEVKSLHLDQKWLVFRAMPNYPPMYIDVLTYEIEERANQSNGTIFYIAEGIKADCVHYVVPTKFNNTLFYLTQDICGISKSVFQ